MSTVETGNWHQLPWETLCRGVEQAVLLTGTDEMSCMLHRIQNGHEVRPRIHDSVQMILILEGECDYYVEGRPHRLAPGSWITVPAGAEFYTYVYDSTEPCLQITFCVPGCQPFTGELTAWLTALKDKRAHPCTQTAEGERRGIGETHA